MVMTATTSWPPGVARARPETTAFYQHGDGGHDAPCTVSTPRSRKPRKPSPVRPRSNGTGSSPSMAAPRRSTGNWRPKCGPWPVGNRHVTNLDASPEFVIGAYTSCGTSSTRSECPNTTSRPARSTTGNANRSTPTSPSCSPAWRSRTGSGHSGWTIKKLVRTLRRFRQVTINTGNHLVTAEDPIPDDIKTILAKIQPV